MFKAYFVDGETISLVVTMSDFLLIKLNQYHDVLHLLVSQLPSDVLSRIPIGIREQIYAFYITRNMEIIDSSQ